MASFSCLLTISGLALEDPVTVVLTPHFIDCDTEPTIEFGSGWETSMPISIVLVKNFFPKLRWNKSAPALSWSVSECCSQQRDSGHSRNFSIWCTGRRWQVCLKALCLCLFPSKMKKMLGLFLILMKDLSSLSQHRCLHCAQSWSMKVLQRWYRVCSGPPWTSRKSVR